MGAKERAAREIKDRKEGSRNSLNKGPLYLDSLFLERENFVRYLAAVLLPERPGEDAALRMVRERRRV
jgi:hypothetical protein